MTDKFAYIDGRWINLAKIVYIETDQKRMVVANRAIMVFCEDDYSFSISQEGWRQLADKLGLTIAETVP